MLAVVGAFEYRVGPASQSRAVGDPCRTLSRRYCLQRDLADRSRCAKMNEPLVARLKLRERCCCFWRSA
jgi:hypothetical protein